MTELSDQEEKQLKRYERLYDRIRAQVSDENNLYNQRIIWLITMQAFLFATVGLILRGSISSDDAGESLFLKAVYLIIAGTGILVALICYRILGNAREALDSLEDSWNEHLLQMPSGIRHLFPHPRGRVVMRRPQSSGSPPRKLLGSGNLPLVFVLVWPLFVAILLVNWIGS